MLVRFQVKIVLFLYFIQISLHLDPTYVAVNKRMNDGFKKQRCTVGLILPSMWLSQKTLDKKLSLQENWTGRTQSGLIAGLWKQLQCFWFLCFHCPHPLTTRETIKVIYSEICGFGEETQTGDVQNKKGDFTDSVLALRLHHEPAIQKDKNM